MITGAHFLLSYKCDRQCDHCFLYCGPSARGTFTLAQLRAVFAELDRIGTIDNIYFEGGEPFLFWPLMVEGARLAAARSWKVGIVTNGYWARSVDDAEMWLKPLAEIGIADFSVSNDELHDMEDGVDSGAHALQAAKNLGIPCGAICLEKPTVVRNREDKAGAPIVGGDVRFRGRAADNLVDDTLPRKSLSAFTACDDEELRDPGRFHLDAHGHVHICQGISIGNMWETPLSELIASYNADSHPICGPLLRGGPAALAREHQADETGEYVSGCHACYAIRAAIRDRHPNVLAPAQVYGDQA